MYLTKRNDIYRICSILRSCKERCKKETLQKLRKIGVTTKILTGDNPYATSNICNLVGIDNSEILLGTDVDKMTDEELAKKVETVSVFARMNPLQKKKW